MRVLHVINSLATGGAEKLLLETLPLYNRKEVQADLLVLNGTDYPFLQDLKNQKCCQIFSLGTRSAYHPIHIFRIIPYLKRYDLIHVHLFPAQYWVALAKIISLSKSRLIFTEHNTSNRRLNSSLLRIFDKQVYLLYHKVVCITREIKEILLDHTQLSFQRFQIIENGINLSSVYHALPLHYAEIDKRLCESDKILIQVAGFREQKDQTTLIRALTLLPSNIKLLLVGDGILKKQCEALVAALGLSERVLFLGLRMDVPSLLKTADIVVLSSKYEGLSLSCIEGMASGKPFVASNVPGLKEVVEGAGILFPVGDSQILSKVIQELLINPSYYHSVAEACQRRAAEYDIQKMVDQHIKLYESIV